MSVSSVQSGYQIVDMSSKMAEEAAAEIQRQQRNLSMPNDDSYEFNQVEFKAPVPEPSEIEALTKLSSAERYSQIGTNVIQRDQEMIGSLLDIHV
ncbi:hypothetical protein FCU94_13775 [Vibrio sp. JPW-9-11-11]|uniref:hypothetical protein n=1 Tax=Vibrio sp. JPW-9-11-11 TaxID=1416532 RepID=UPI001593480B|nr:hypothetical protein [Vibrio sp. JPW-9-11-11]NVD07956.1 hypothetical protein [Vibrio sp. JPW-9-11-11]